ncbi:SCO4225 family membrane protein, partial [Streptomyces sp. CO7]
MRIKALSRRVLGLTFGSTASRVYLGGLVTLKLVSEVSDRFAPALDMWLTALTSPVRLVLDPVEYLVTADMTGTAAMAASDVTLVVSALVQAALIGWVADRVRRSDEAAGRRAHA